MVKQGPDPRRVIDVGNMSSEDALMLLEALQQSIRECEREEQQEAIKRAHHSAADRQD